jgi:hypothetical protein
VSTALPVDAVESALRSLRHPPGRDVDLRRLAIRYLTLPPTERIAVFTSLGLIDSPELRELSDAELVIVGFARAGDCVRLRTLTAAVEDAHSRLDRRHGATPRPRITRDSQPQRP